MIDDDVEPGSIDYVNDNEPRKTESVKNDLSPLNPRKTKAQIWEDTVIQFLTFTYLYLQQTKLIKLLLFL